SKLSRRGESHSSPDVPSFPGEEVVEALALIALELDGIVSGLAPRSARLLQFLREALQELGVPRKTVDHRNFLSGAGVLEEETRGDLDRDRILRREGRRTPAVLRGPAALRADPAFLRRIDGRTLHGFEPFFR